jgi:hypothetical protein
MEPAFLKELEEANGRLSRRMIRLRMMQLQDWTMTPAELAEHRRLEAEDQADLDEARIGNASRDAMK